MTYTAFSLTEELLCSLDPNAYEAQHGRCLSDSSHPHSASDGSWESVSSKIPVPLGQPIIPNSLGEFGILNRADHFP